MIDENSLDGIGWARFSDDRRMRYRLARSLTEPGRSDLMDRMGPARGIVWEVRRVVFVMLNPSTADAFKLDPTVSKCCQFARRWGADVLEVVNLFALRSPYPADLYERFGRGEPLGTDIENDRAIVEACSGAARVIAAWGNHGHLRGRATYVRDILRERHIGLEHLGLTKDGYPIHPLSRGKSFVPLDREPVAWT